MFYIFGDNGSSAEGQSGTISELLAQNNIPNTVEQQLAALDRTRRARRARQPEDRQHVSCRLGLGRQHAVPHTKLVASHFGGTRNPLVISWPEGIKPDKTPRAQFHHVNDIAPTIYDIIGIKPPKVVDGFTQDPIDGVSMAYTFADREGAGPEADPVFREQRQPRHLSRWLVLPAPSVR